MLPAAHLTSVQDQVVGLGLSTLPPGSIPQPGNVLILRGARQTDGEPPRNRFFRLVVFEEREIQKNLQTNRVHVR